MRNWLAAKAEEERRRQEEERRRQEEEKTRQESLRLEQRKIEHEMLRTSLSGGIPPVMVPVVFAGLGGGILPQQILEWAQHVMAQLQQSQPPQLPPPPPLPQSAVSPDHQRRGSQGQGFTYPASAGVPSTPGSAHAPPGSFSSSYPASPTGRTRGNTLPGSLGRPQLGPGAGGGLPGIQTGAGQAIPPHMVPQLAQGQPQHSAAESQPSPSIYFHHWQPPVSQGGQAGGTAQASTPTSGLSRPSHSTSAEGSNKKAKYTG